MRDSLICNVGEFNGEKVSYDPSTDVLNCKNVNTFFSIIEKFQRDQQVRTWLDNGETILIRRRDTFVLGCLEDTKKVFEGIYKNVHTIKYGK